MPCLGFGVPAARSDVSSQICRGRAVDAAGGTGGGRRLGGRRVQCLQPFADGHSVGRGCQVEGYVLRRLNLSADVHGGGRGWMRTGCVASSKALASGGATRSGAEPRFGRIAPPSRAATTTSPPLSLVPSHLL
uniref:Uncharacterized protein n=1 Tax=Oryza punctata TaxID=4537 RepID=A0A0E0MJL8_ORYPU